MDIGLSGPFETRPKMNPKGRSMGESPGLLEQVVGVDVYR